MSGRRREKETPWRLVFFYLVLLLVLAFDQITKYLALHYLAATESSAVIPNIFHLTLVHNTGIAFGFFRQHPSVLLSLISISLLFLFFWGARMPKENSMERFSLALILGGAIGNWIDRVRFGAVIDFLDFRVWPVFNIADSAITVGVILLAWLMIRKKSS